MDSRLLGRLRKFAQRVTPKWQIVLVSHTDIDRDLIMTRRDLIELLDMAELSQYAPVQAHHPECPGCIPNKPAPPEGEWRSERNR